MAECAQKPSPRCKASSTAHRDKQKNFSLIYNSITVRKEALHAESPNSASQAKHRESAKIKLAHNQQQRQLEVIDAYSIPLQLARNQNRKTPQNYSSLSSTPKNTSFFLNGQRAEGKKIARPSAGAHNILFSLNDKRSPDSSGKAVLFNKGPRLPQIQGKLISDACQTATQIAESNRPSAVKPVMMVQFEQPEKQNWIEKQDLEQFVNQKKDSPLVHNLNIESARHSTKPQANALNQSFKIYTPRQTYNNDSLRSKMRYSSR